jgi:subtilase family serine protease
MQIEMVLPPADPGQLASVLGALYAKSSPQYHHWLGAGQFVQRFGPDPGAVSRLQQWLGSVGLGSGHLSGFALKVSAPAARVASAFDLSFETYRLSDHEDGYRADRAPLLPADVAGGIGAVLGLDDMTSLHFDHILKKPDVSEAAGQLDVQRHSPCATATSIASQNGILTPDQVGDAYGVGALLGSGQTGAGQTVAAYELGSHSNFDVDEYESCFGLADPISTVYVDGGASVNAEGTAEADVDIEQIATQAPGASIVSYEGPNTVTGAYDTWASIVNDDSASVISASVGLCEPDAAVSGFLSEDTLLAQAAAQGQTVLVASGDSGSEGCFVDTAGPNAYSTALDVDFPASDPWVTAVGGTSGLGTTQSVWNLCEGLSDSSCASDQGGIGASGGGISQYFAQPSWQPAPYQWSTPTNPCGGSCRNVPDISADADFQTFFVGGGWVAGGATSVAAPLIAGLVVDTVSGCGGVRKGDLAPFLYGLADQGGYGTSLTPVLNGDNDLTRTYGGVDFPAGPGYNPATGLGTPLVGGWPCPAPAPPPVTQGYDLVGADGGIFTFGTAPYFGSMGGRHLDAPVVGMATDVSTGGYWMAASDGGVFAFNAPFYGSMGGTRLDAPIVGMASDNVTGGYWLVASDGGVFAFNAPFYGSMGGTRLDAPIVGMAVMPFGTGYWLVAKDGGVFAFGNAPFDGSMGGTPLHRPVVGMAADPATGGYWLVASDGGIFAFDAPFDGSMGGTALDAPIVGMAATRDQGGYWLVGSDGGIFSFGDAQFLGSEGGTRLDAPIVGMATAG